MRKFQVYIFVICLVACFIGLVIFFQEHPDLYHRLRDTVGGFLASALIIFRKAISSALVSFRKAISTALVSISSALVSLRKAISSALVTFCSTFLSIWNRLVRAVRNPTGDKTQNPGDPSLLT